MPSLDTIKLKIEFYYKLNKASYAQTITNLSSGTIYLIIGKSQ
jgi:hypothetical protein